MIDSLYDTFKPWSAKGSVYIISDTHFEDKDCLLMDSNWITPQEHIERIKARVHKCDTLIHLGDVGNPEYLSQLNCHKVLITGNHDRKGEMKKYFDEIFDGALFISPKIVLSHEPLPFTPFYLNIHGHDHSYKSHSPYHINLASNVVGYSIFNLGKEINKGILSPIISIHRYTIDNAIKEEKEWS